jgi:Ankyrin repeats (3 copies)
MKLLDSLRRSSKTDSSVCEGKSVSAPASQKEARLLDFLSGGSGEFASPTRQRKALSRPATTSSSSSSSGPNGVGKERSASTVNEVSGMLRLVHERKHFAIMYILLSNDVDVPRLIGGCSKAVDEPFLHHLLKSSPNPELVELLLAKMGDDDDDAMLDVEGRTALHVAAGFGCDSAVIKLLLEGDGRIQASVLDNLSRTPLHWACFNPSGLNKDGTGNPTSADLNSMLDTMALLLESYPEAIGMPDKKGRKPLDLAKRHRADAAVIELLEGAQRGEKVWKKRGISKSAKLTIPSSVDDGENFDSCSDMSSVGWDVN